GAAFATLSLMIVMGGAAFSLLSVCLPMAKAPLFEPEPEHLNPAMLPATAPVSLEELPDEVPPAELAEDNGEVAVVRWEPEHRLVRATLTEANHYGFARSISPTGRRPLTASRRRSSRAKTSATFRSTSP